MFVRSVALDSMRSGGGGEVGDGLGGGGIEVRMGEQGGERQRGRETARLVVGIDRKIQNKKPFLILPA